MGLNMAKKSILNIAVMGSTRGTDLDAVIKAVNKGRLKGKARISVVISNKKDALILKRAENAGLDTVLIDGKGMAREEFDKTASKVLESYKVKLIVLIGYMRYLSKWFVDKYKNKIMNIHPSLLPAFSGGMDKNVHKEILDWGCKVTGCTLHFVDEGADTGPIIVQKAVKITEKETVESLKKKVQKEEGDAIVEAIKLFAEGRLKVRGRKVYIA